MSRRASGLCALGLALLAFRASADGIPVPPPVSAPGAPQSVSGAQMNQLRGYGTQLGESWIKDTLGLDLPGLAGGVQQSLQDAWDDDGWGDVGGGGAPSASVQASGASPTAGAGSGAGKGLSLRFTETNNVANLSQGLRNVPFGVELNDSFRFSPSAAPLRTRVSIPLSPNDAWRAEARMPLDLSSTADAWWWHGLGLGRKLSLRSDMSSKLGFNQVEAGMGADWRPGFWGVWDLNYAWQINYGQGSGASVNWLKVSKRF